MHNLSFLFAVFAIVWAAFFLYAFFLNSQIRALRQELMALQDDLSARKDGEK